MEARRTQRRQPGYRKGEIAENCVECGRRASGQRLDHATIVALGDGMIRTQIQLDERQYRELKALGAQSGKGLAQQVREAVGVYLAQQGARSVPLETALGRFRPSVAKGLKPHDRDYVETLR